MVLDSQPQNPLGLQGHDVLAIRTACRSLLFSSGLQIVETLVWLIWQLPSPHLNEASPRQGRCCLRRVPAASIQWFLQ